MLANSLGHTSSLDKILHDEKYVYTAGDSLFVWDKRTFQLVATLCHSRFRAIALDSDHVYTMSNDSIAIWRKSDWTPVQSVPNEGALELGIFVDDQAIFTFRGKLIEKRDRHTLEVLEFSELEKIPGRAFRAFRDISVFENYVLGMDTVSPNELYWTKWDKVTLDSLYMEGKWVPNAYESLCSDKGVIYTFSNKSIFTINPNDLGVTVLKDESAEIRCLAARDGRIYVGLRDGSVVVRNSSTLEKEATLEIAKGSWGLGINDIDVDESRVYVGAWDTIFTVFEIGSWKEVFSSSGKDRSFRVVSYDDEYIYTGKENGEITIWSKKDLSQRILQLQLKDRLRGLTSDMDYLYVRSGYVTEYSQTSVIQKKDWKVIKDLIMSELQFSLLPKGDCIINYEDNGIRVWSKDFEEVAFLESSDSHFFHGDDYDQKADMDLSHLYLVTVDSDFVYVAYRYSLFVWSRITESYIAAVELEREAESIGFDEVYLYVTNSRRKFIVLDKSKFSILKTLEIGECGRIYQDEENVYVIGGFHLSIIEKSSWVLRKILNTSVVSLVSDRGYLRTLNVFGQERFYETQEFMEIEKDQTPWSTAEDNPLLIFSKSCLVYIPAIHEVEKLKQHLSNILQLKAPLVIIGDGLNPVAVVEPCYVNNNQDIFSKHLENLRRIVKGSSE
jgi:hypothetical protein